MFPFRDREKWKWLNWQSDVKPKKKAHDRLVVWGAVICRAGCRCRRFSGGARVPKNIKPGDQGIMIPRPRSPAWIGHLLRTRYRGPIGAVSAADQCDKLSHRTRYGAESLHHHHSRLSLRFSLVSSPPSPLYRKSCEKKKKKYLQTWTRENWTAT